MVFLGNCGCCGGKCPENTCGCSCSCSSLATPQPAIKVFDISCEAWCTGGLYAGYLTLPGGSQTESIPYYASTNPTLINGCCYTLWELRSEWLNEQFAPENALEQFCYKEGEVFPKGPITVTVKCCPGTPEYSIAYLYRHFPVLSNYLYGAPIDNQKLCVVDGILKGCVVLNLRSNPSYGNRSNCQLRLVFGDGTPSPIAANTPTFGTPTSTANGFTVQISNYDANFTYAGTATVGGSVAISNTGLVTVTGVAAYTSCTATITTARTNYECGSAQVTAMAGAPNTPTFGTPTSTANGFTVQITNYSNLFTYGGAATANGIVAISNTGLVTVTGVPANTFSTATITTSHTNFQSGSAQVTATSLNTTNNPTFGTPTPSTDGFTVQITNYDNDFTYGGTATENGTVSIDGSGFVTVSGVATYSSSTATITTTRINSVSGSGQVTAMAVEAANNPTFDTPTPTGDGFTVQITNYDSNFTYEGTATANGIVYIDWLGVVAVSGVAENTPCTVTVTTTRIDYESGSGQVTA